MTDDEWRTHVDLVAAEDARLDRLQRARAAVIPAAMAWFNAGRPAYGPINDALAVACRALVEMERE